MKKEERKPRGYWNKETCYTLAKECSTKNDMLKKNGAAYHLALKNGWISDYVWFRNGYLDRPSRGGFERCRNIALTCKTYGEFLKKDKSAYNTSYRNGWLPMFDWLTRSDKKFTKKVDSVYVYEFKDLNIAYIGRTGNVKKRDTQHRTFKESSVFSFAKTHNVNVPKIKILATNLTIEEGLIKEDEFCKIYISNGWTLINKAKTGLQSGSIGWIGTKWTKKKCKEEALKYKTLKEFRLGSQVAYRKALANGWIPDYTWISRT